MAHLGRDIRFFFWFKSTTCVILSPRLFSTSSPDTLGDSPTALGPGLTTPARAPRAAARCRKSFLVGVKQIPYILLKKIAARAQVMILHPWSPALGGWSGHRGSGSAARSGRCHPRAARGWCRRRGPGVTAARRQARRRQARRRWARRRQARRQAQRQARQQARPLVGRQEGIGQENDGAWPRPLSSPSSLPESATDLQCSPLETEHWRSVPIPEG